MRIALDFQTAVGLLAAVLVIAALSMRTMVPLRIAGIASNIAFVIYGFLIDSLPIVMLHSILFPLNVYRLFEMLRLVRQVKLASTSDLSVDWLRVFMRKRTMAPGEVLFRKGDDADRMFFVLDGRMRLHELGLDVLPGTVVGELGMLAPARKRTQTLECKEGGSLLEIGYDKIQQLYYENPSFGFYFLRLSSARLFDNIHRLELALGDRDDEIVRLRALLPAASSPTQ
jgi:CRP/FNR family cyclic AMP-dependent transcriptional regulator